MVRVTLRQATGNVRPQGTAAVLSDAGGLRNSKFTLCRLGLADLQPWGAGSAVNRSLP